MRVLCFQILTTPLNFADCRDYLRCQVEDVCGKHSHLSVVRHKLFGFVCTEFQVISSLSVTILYGWKQQFDWYTEAYNHEAVITVMSY